MLVKKTEKEGKIKALYSSSTICASEFNTINNELTVIFNNGGIYKYPNIDLTDYTRFETADSNGSVFNTYIKKKYNIFESLGKLSENEISLLNKEVNILKEVDKKAITDFKTKKIISIMSNLITNFVNTEKIKIEDLKLLNEEITNFLNN